MCIFFSLISFCFYTFVKKILSSLILDSNGKAVRYSNGIQPLFDNLNNKLELVWYSDPYCIFLMNKVHAQSALQQPCHIFRICFFSFSHSGRWQNTGLTLLTRPFTSGSQRKRAGACRGFFQLKDFRMSW